MKTVLAVALLVVSTAGLAQSYYTPPPQSNGYYNPNTQQRQQPQPTYNTPAPDHQVNGYVKQNGTYVEPYRATNPDATKTNNYSYPGNYNPNVK